MESIGIDQARKDWGGVVDRAHYGEPVLTTRTGKPWTVTVSVEHMLKVWGIAASTVGGGEYARLRRELREAANAPEEGE